MNTELHEKLLEAGLEPESYWFKVLADEETPLNKSAYLANAFYTCVGGERRQRFETVEEDNGIASLLHGKASIPADEKLKNLCAYFLDPIEKNDRDAAIKVAKGIVARINELGGDLSAPLTLLPPRPAQSLRLRLLYEAEYSAADNSTSGTTEEEA